MTAILSLKDWTITRDGAPLLGPVNATCLAREITTLMGPSGVGKTTALLALLGYTDQGVLISGIREFGGRRLDNGDLPHQCSIYIPQQLPFNPNWEVGSFLCRLPWGEHSWWHLFWPETPSRRRHVSEVLSRIGLGGKLRSTVAELSGGESQRAALAQLLLLHPRLFVADEITAGLDVGMARWTLDQIRNIVFADAGAAVLALHDVHASLHVSDRIILLWPASLQSGPWTLLKQSMWWCSDALHALLCLAHWGVTFGHHRAFRALVGYLGQGPQLLNGSRLGFFASDGTMSCFSSEFPPWLPAAATVLDHNCFAEICVDAPDHGLYCGLRIPASACGSSFNHGMAFLAHIPGPL